MKIDYLCPKIRKEGWFENYKYILDTHPKNKPSEFLILKPIHIYGAVWF